MRLWFRLGKGGLRAVERDPHNRAECLSALEDGPRCPDVRQDQVHLFRPEVADLALAAGIDPDGSMMADLCALPT